jgi:hypothetical protein
MSPRDLPGDRERALDAIAGGWARTPTAAHPLCCCGKPYHPACPACGAKANTGCKAHTDDDHVRPDGTHYARPAVRNGTDRDCPVHGVPR